MRPTELTAPATASARLAEAPEAGRSARPPWRAVGLPWLVSRLLAAFGLCVLGARPFGTLDLDAYLTIAPRVPDETRFHIGPFVVQAELGETGSNCAAHFVLASQPPEDGYFPVLLDITTQLTAPLAPNDDAGILERLLRLRHLKNRIFHQSLTDTCQALYR